LINEVEILADKDVVEAIGNVNLLIFL